MNWPALLSLAIMALAPSSMAAAQAVPEGIHSEGKATPEVCGLTAATVVDLEAAIRARPDAEPLQGTDEYTAIATSVGGMRVLTFTTPQNRAHPAVACRQVVDNPGGGSTIQTSIACFNSRENCDWLYRQFEELNDRAIKSMEGRK